VAIGASVWRQSTCASNSNNFREETSTQNDALRRELRRQLAASTLGPDESEPFCVSARQMPIQSARTLSHAEKTAAVVTEAFQVPFHTQPQSRLSQEWPATVLSKQAIGQGIILCRAQRSPFSMQRCPSPSINGNSPSYIASARFTLKIRETNHLGLLSRPLPDIFDRTPPLQSALGPGSQPDCRGTLAGSKNSKSRFTSRTLTNYPSGRLLTCCNLSAHIGPRTGLNQTNCIATHSHRKFL
jgi:hypothetical protein